MSNWFIHQLRKRKRVYILPTKMGGYLNGLIFLMFLLSIGYNNNLLLIFTLILFAFNIIWVIQTHFNLSRLKLDQLKIDNGHSLSTAKVRLSWARMALDNQYDLEIQTYDKKFAIKNVNKNENFESGEVFLPSRGLLDWKYLKVSTDRPFGLYQVWIYFPLKETSLAYPSLLRSLPFPETTVLDQEGEKSSLSKGQEGVHELSRYQGEESRRISWKHYARMGDLLVKEGESLKNEMITLELNLPMDQAARELKLSEIATILKEAHDRQIPFTFIGKRKLGPGLHQELLKECLKELTLC